MRPSRRGFIAAAATVPAIVHAAGEIQAFGLRWTVPNATDWKVDREDDVDTLRLVTARAPADGPRRPFQFALANLRYAKGVNVELEMQPLGRSLLIVFAYRDPAHFDYAHLSTDTGAAEPNHNGIFHVYGGERARISSTAGPAAFRGGGIWHRVRLAHDAVSGAVHVNVDGKAVIALHAVDLSLGPGQVGIGSFDETGLFRSVTIRSQ